MNSTPGLSLPRSGKEAAMSYLTSLLPLSGF